MKTVSYLVYASLNLQTTIYAHASMYVNNFLNNFI